MLDARNILADADINLGKSPEGMFGNAVEDFSRGGSEMGRGESFNNQTQKPQRTGRAFAATSYAAALAGATGFRPKLKFLFKVEFFFTQEAKDLMAKINGDEKSNLLNNDFTFLVKSVDRPKIDMEYEDDVNMYNFRTKVLKKIRHRELTMTFLDDTGNRVFSFFDKLMMLHSPITRRSKSRANPHDKPSAMINGVGSGMTFSQLGDDGAADFAHRGNIESPVGTAIESIRIKQIFVDSSEQDISKALKQNYFDFINPRIVSFDLDDLNHETSEANQLTLQFDYDWLELATVIVDNKDKLSPDYSHIVSPSVIDAPGDVSPSSDSNGAPATGGSGNKNSFNAAPVKMTTSAKNNFDGAGNGRLIDKNGSPLGYGGNIFGIAPDSQNGMFDLLKSSNSPLITDSTIGTKAYPDAFVSNTILTEETKFGYGEE